MKITPGNVFFLCISTAVSVADRPHCFLPGKQCGLNSVVHSYRSYHSAEMNSGTSGLVTRYSFTYIDGACNNQSAFLAEILITRTVLWLIFISAYSLFCLCNRFLCVCVCLLILALIGSQLIINILQSLRQLYKFFLSTDYCD